MLLCVVVNKSVLITKDTLRVDGHLFSTEKNAINILVHVTGVCLYDHGIFMLEGKHMFYFL